jgi:3'-5' exoribonuclease
MDLERTMISEFVQGDSITGFFVLQQAQLVHFENSDMLRLELVDSSGRVPGVVWEGAAGTYNEIKGADVVKVKAVVSSYRDRMQLKVEKIREAKPDEYDPAQLVRVAQLGIEKLKEKFDGIASTVKDPFLAELLRVFKSDSETYDRYFRTPAGKRFHHDYVGGLAEHSLAMATAADRLCETLSLLDRDLLICGAIFHDVGKIAELGGELRMDYTDDGRLVGHMALGDEILCSLISRIPDFPAALERKLRHMVASHHGEREFGATVLPQTREAYVLHHIDKIDSGLNVFQHYDSQRTGDWGEYVNLWERYLYFG